MSEVLCEQSRSHFYARFLSRKQASPRLGPRFGVLFARRASPCSPLPTLPGAASAVLALSPGEPYRTVFVFFSK